jgi:hypothetical protein
MGRIGQVPWNKGRTGVYSEEALARFSQVQKNRTPEHQQKLNDAKKGSIPWNKGRVGVFHHSEATKLKISQSTKGEGGNNWKGGITPENKLGRTSVEYKGWQTAVFQKDNFTCQVCSQYNGYLHADHIKPYAEHLELRYDVNNGRTLCRACHYYVTFKRKMPTGSRWGLRLTNGVFNAASS